MALNLLGTSAIAVGALAASLDLVVLSVAAVLKLWVGVLLLRC